MQLLRSIAIYSAISLGSSGLLTDSNPGIMEVLSVPYVPPTSSLVGGDKFLDSVSMGAGKLGIMSSTIVTLDGEVTSYWDVPDDAELVEISIDMRRNVLSRMVYIKIKSRKI